MQAPDQEPVSDDGPIVDAFGFRMSLARFREMAEEADVRYEAATPKWRRIGNLSWLVVISAIAAAYIGKQQLGYGFLGTAAVSISVVVISGLAIVIPREAYKRKVFRQILCEHGYPVCVGCGYNLSYLDDNSLACPECGLERKVT